MVDLSALVPRFLLRLDDRLRRIEIALDTVNSDGSKRIEELMRDFHSLAGIGGTYGFPELTTLARRGEHLFRQAFVERRAIQVGEALAARGLVEEMDAIRVRAGA